MFGEFYVVHTSTPIWDRDWRFEGEADTKGGEQILGRREGIKNPTQSHISSAVFQGVFCR